MLVAVSASHAHLDLGVLDSLTRNADQLPEHLAGVGSQIAGAVVLSTCNRLEIYMDAPRFHDAVESAIDAVAAVSAVGRDDVMNAVELSMNQDAATHLYEVIAGLDSMVMGEAEILGQVRTAFTTALEAGHTTAMLNDLFSIGLQHAKRVTSNTDLGQLGRSSGAVALARASEHLSMPLADATILILGTGAYARVITAELARHSATKVSVYSNSGRGADYARSHRITAIEPEQLAAAVAGADVIVAASGQGEKVVRASDVRSRDARPLVVLDLALASDVEPEVAQLSGVTVLTLPDIADSIDDAEQIDQARAVLEEGVRAFTARQHMRTVDPAVTYLRSAVGDAVDSEVARIRRRYDAQVAEDFERSLHRIAAKALHSPTVRARQLARDGEAHRYVAALHTLFGVDVETADDPSKAPTE